MIRLVTIISCKPYPTIIWFILSQVIMLFHISTGHRPFRKVTFVFVYARFWVPVKEKNKWLYIFGTYFLYFGTTSILKLSFLFQNLYIWQWLDIDCTTEFVYQHEHLNVHEAIYILHCSFYFPVNQRMDRYCIA